MTTQRSKTFALVGNPNCGKTTIFNGLTGGNHRIGNWPGVTVEKKEGSLRMTEPGHFLAAPFVTQGAVMDSGHTVRPNLQPLISSKEPITLVDLPGIYSLTATTEDERVARDFLLYEDYDLVINIIDAANLERNLYLSLQLMELGVPRILVLNMMDLAKSRGITIDVQQLSQTLGVPVIGIQGTQKRDIQSLTSLLTATLGLAEFTPEVPYSPVLHQWLVNPQTLQAVKDSEVLKPLGRFSDTPGGHRWFALQVLENPPLVDEMFAHHLSGEPRAREARTLLLDGRNQIQKTSGEDPDILAAEDKYQFVGEIGRKCCTKALTKERLSDKIDSLVMHRYLGIPIFMAVMYGVFWFTISVGGAFIDFFDLAAGALFVDGLGHLLWTLGSPQWLTAILAQGIGSGLQTVSTFIPIIFSMFLALTILEDSGYMARAAFVMDRFMQFLGLPGKAFIPMIVGFGCTVPGIMGTRTLESTKDRFTTIFMTPFMSCGARLPVYALFVVALFPQASGLIVFSIYLSGIGLAVLTGLLLRSTVFRGASSHFVMELPPYHSPRLRFAFQNSWSRVSSFVVRAGVVIVLAVGILSLLNSVSVTSDGLRFGEPDRQDSVLSSVSRFITPAFTPMGIDDDNWPATVGLFTGVFAKEVIVGTLHSLYAQGEDWRDSDTWIDNETGARTTLPPDEAFPLFERLAEAVTSIWANFAGLFGALLDPLGLGGFGDLDEESAETSARVGKFFTAAQGYAYMLFVLIYTPCMAAVGAAIREMGQKWGLILTFYLLFLAWGVAVLFYQIAEGGSLAWGLGGAGVLGLLVGFFVILGRQTKGFRPLGAEA